MRRHLPLVRDALAIGLADGIFAISFGSLAVAHHFSVAEASALSLAAFTGASQFALVAVVAAGGSPFIAVVSALVLGMRNLLYALRIRDLLPRRLWPLRAQFVIDETTGMTLRENNAAARSAAFAITAASVFVLWNAGTLAGALAGLSIGDPRRWGLDASGPAVFLALLFPLLRGRRELLAAVAAVVVTFAISPFVPAGIPVLVAGAVAVLLVVARP